LNRDRADRIEINPDRAFQHSFIPANQEQLRDNANKILDFRRKRSNLAFTGAVQDNNISGYSSVPPELILAVVASRSSLVGALLRNAIPAKRDTISEFLCGLSHDELECLAEFQGACVLEQGYSVAFHPYRLMADFFDPCCCDRWRNPDDRANKVFVVLAYLDHLQDTVSIRIQPSSIDTA